MKVSYTRILLSRQALSRLLNEKLPPRAAYNIAKMVKFINDTVANDIDLYRQKVFDSLGIKEGDEAALSAVADQVNEEMESFLKNEIEVPVGGLKLSDLGTNAAITPNEILALDYLISE